MQVTATDDTGNISEPTPAIVDQTAPAAPVVNPLASTDTTPLVTGSAEPGSTIQVEVNGTTFMTTADADGMFSVDTENDTPTAGAPFVPLTDGVHDVSVTATDAAGNSATDTTLSEITIDTTGPVAPTFSDITVTADNTVNIVESISAEVPVTGTVTGAQLGDVVTVTANGTEYTGAVDAMGAFTVNIAGSDLSMDPDVTLDISIATADALGNTTVSTETLGYTIDTTPPVVATANPLATNDTTPVITGTAEPGATVEVDVGGTTFTTVADPDGNFSVDTENDVPTEGGPFLPLPEGIHVIGITSIDPAGNTSEIEIDITPPIVPVVEPLATNDTTPVITGTAEAGSTVELEVNGTTFITTAGEDGTFSVNTESDTPSEGAPFTPLQDGISGVSVASIDAAGNRSSDTIEDAITIDITPPPAPVISGITVAADDFVNAAEATESTLPVTGMVAGAQDGDTVTITANGNEFTGTVDAAGAFTVNVSAADLSIDPDSTLDISVETSDQFGNTAIGSVAQSYISDTLVPVAPVIDSQATSNSMPVITGTAEPGSTVELEINGTTFTTIATPDGTFSVDTENDMPTAGAPFVALPEQAYIVTATSTDDAGNRSPEAIVSILIDQTLPAVPTVDVLVTNDTTPLITGTAEVGTSVDIVLNGSTFTVIVESDGTFVLDTEIDDPSDGGTFMPLIDGSYDVSVSSTDSAGNTAADTTTNELTIDTMVPDAPTLNPTDGDPITGTAEPGSTVTIFDAMGNAIGTATADAMTGEFSIVPTPVPANGTEITATAIDASGNESGPATETVDQTALAPPTLNPTDGDPITGTAEPGSTVTIFDAMGNVIGTATAGAMTGEFSIVPAPVPANGAEITATATDALGNESGPATETIDQTAPMVPTLNPTDGDPITGTAEPGSTVTIFDAMSNEIGTGTADAMTGEFSITPSSVLLNGEDITATSTDDAGNESGPAMETVDAMAPAIPTVVELETNDTTPVISGTAMLGMGETLEVLVDGVTYSVANGNLSIGNAGNWSLTPAVALGEGTHQVVARITDAAGNATADTTTDEIVIDTMAPSTPTAPTSYDDNEGDIASATSTAAVTDDATPGINVGAGLTDTPALYVDGAKVAATYDAMTGTLTPDVALTDGTYEFTYTLTDAAGNESAESGSLEIEVDTGTTVSITSSANGILTGTAEANATVEIDIDDDGMVDYTVTADGSGDWSQDISTDLPTAQPFISGYDIAGDGESDGEFIEITLPSGVDPATLVLSFYNQAGNVIGSSLSSFFPNSSEITLQEVFDRVDPMTGIASATLGSPALDLRVIENTSEPGTFVITIPAEGGGSGWQAATLTQLANPGDSNGVVISAVENSVNPASLSGGFGDGAEPTVYSGHNDTNNVSIDSEGTGTLVSGGSGDTQTTNGTNATYVPLVVSVTATDAVGNTATDSSNVDYIFPSPTINSLVTGLDTVVTGRAEPNSTVDLYDASGDLIAEDIPTNAIGDWTYTPTMPFDDDTSLEVRQTDATGNMGSSMQTVAIDTDADGVRDTIDIDDDNDGIIDTKDTGSIPLDFSGFSNAVADVGTSQDLNTFEVAGEPITASATLVTRLGNNTGSGDADGNFLLGDNTPGDIPDATTGVELELSFTDAVHVVFTEETGAGNLAGPGVAGGSLGGDQIRLEAAGGFTVYDPDGQLTIVSNMGDVLIFEPSLAIAGDPSNPYESNDGNGTYIITTNQPVTDVNLQGDGDNRAPIRVSVLGDADTDNDGILNRLDTDSDSDNGGIDDNIEAQYGQTFVAASGVDSDGNGLDDAYESAPGAGEGITPADVDQNGIAEFLETENLNGVETDIPPVVLSPLVTGLNTTISGVGVPGSTIALTDENGVPIALIDENGDPIDPAEITVGADGTFTAIPEMPLADDTEVTATQTEIPNVPGVSVTDTQILAIDTDADGVRDTIDIDDDNDGILDTNELSLDLQNAVAANHVGGTADATGTLETGGETIGLTVSVSNGALFSGSSSDIPGFFVFDETNAGTIETTFDTPVSGIEIDFVSLLVSVGNFTVTLQDGTVISNLDVAVGADLPSTFGRTSTFLVREEQVDGTIVLNDPVDGTDQSGGSISFPSLSLAEISAGGGISAIAFDVTNPRTQSASAFFQVRGGILADVDLDGDGAINSLDTDSDGGGTDDNVEALYSQTFVAASGVDSDGNGLDDAYESAPGAGEGITPADTNNDGTPDYLDAAAPGTDALPLSLNTLVTGLDTVITGIGVPGSTIALTDSTDAAIATDAPIIVASDGTWSVTPTTPLADDTQVTATQTLPAAHPLAGTASDVTETLAIDTDADGVRDTIDIDDDNDGILDTNEQPQQQIQNFSDLDWTSSGEEYEINGTQLRWVDDTNDTIQPDGAISRMVSGLSNLAVTNVNGTDYVQLTYDFTPEIESGPLNIAFFIELGGVRYQGIAVPSDDQGSFPNSISTTSGGAILSTNSAASYAPNEVSTIELLIPASAITSDTMLLSLEVVNNQGSASFNGPRQNVTIDNFGFVTSDDADQDGIVNQLDTDSDNGGIDDNIEAQYGQTFIAASGMDSDSDGLDDAYDQTPTTGAAGSVGLGISNTDGDTVPDYQDTDGTGVDAPPFALNPLVTGLQTVITGFGVPGSTVELTDAGGSIAAPITVGLDGTWTATPTTPLTDGTLVTGTQSNIPDFAGVTSTDSETLSIDTDGDDVRDTIDIDDDNDGILDINEMAPGALTPINVTDIFNPGNTTLNGDTVVVTGEGTDSVTRSGNAANGPIGEINFAHDTETSYTFTFEDPTVFVIGSKDGADGGFFDNEEEWIVSSAGATFTVFDPNGDIGAPGTAASPTASTVSLDGTIASDTLAFASTRSGNNHSDDWLITSSPVTSITIEYDFLSGGNNSGVIQIFTQGYVDIDTDMDGIVDRLDIDSDGGGIDDNIEAQNGQPVVAPSGIDSDANGLDDAYESTPNAGEGLTPTDTDGDGTPDYQDSAFNVDTAVQADLDNGIITAVGDVDTILFEGDGVMLDFNAISPGTFSNISEIDISGTDGNTLSLANLVDLTPADNTLTIIGEIDDTLVLEAGVTTDGTTQTVDGETFDVYTDAGSTFTLLVDQDLNVV